MAKVYVTEYSRLADDEPGRTIQAGQEPPNGEHDPTIGANSVQTDQFNPETRIIMVHCEDICHLAIGKDPKASTSSRRLPADSTVFYGLPVGHNFKLAVIAGA